MLHIGTVLKAQGVRGELKVKPLVSDAAQFPSFKTVYLRGQSLRILSAALRDGFVFLRLEGIDDRTAAEAAAGEKLFIESGAELNLTEGSYLISDVTGCAVFDDGGERLGVITDILQHGAADVICMKTDNGAVMFPHLKRVVLNVDCAGRRVTVSRAAFKEVAVYED